MSDWMASFEALRHALPNDPATSRVAYAVRHGTMRAGLYAPAIFDGQATHAQDELYIVASGEGTFVKGGDHVRFGPRDMIFVEAGVEHRFKDFSADFMAFVMFWGPDGGEAIPAPGTV